MVTVENGKILDAIAPNDLPRMIFEEEERAFEEWWASGLSKELALYEESLGVMKSAARIGWMARALPGFGRGDATVSGD